MDFSVRKNSVSDREVLFSGRKIFFSARKDNHESIFWQNADSKRSHRSVECSCRNVRLTTLGMGPRTCDCGRQWQGQGHAARCICMLHAACCTACICMLHLHAAYACCILHPASCALHSASCILHPASAFWICMLRVARCMLHVA